MKRITRTTYLTPEEAEKYRKIREQVDKELPELLERHQQRMEARMLRSWTLVVVSTEGHVTSDESANWTDVIRRVQDLISQGNVASISIHMNRAAKKSAVVEYHGGGTIAVVNLPDPAEE